MEIKEKFWLFCFIADALILIGWFIPFFIIEILGITVYTWAWGLVSALGLVVMLPLEGTILVMFLIAIIILILVIINVIFCYFFIKKREAKKIHYMSKVVIGIIILILAMAILGIGVPMFPFAGFYMILIGALIQIITAIIAYRAE